MPSPAATRYISGHCGAGNGHDRCRGAYAGAPCACDCHKVPSPAPEITVTLAVQIAGMTTGGNDLDVLTEQLAGYFIEQLRRFTDPRDADLFLAIAVHADDGRPAAGGEYRVGRYVKDEEAPRG